MNEINKLDASLYVDVYCYHCKKRCAMSNTTQIDGRYYCDNCKMLYENNGDDTSGTMIGSHEN